MSEQLSAAKVPVLYYIQKADECVNLYDKASRAALKKRQFEWTSCGYYHDKIETGLVEGELSESYLPVAIGGLETSNRGVKGENFARWFKNVEGVSESMSGWFNLSLENGVLTYEDENFHPVDGLFTMSFGLPIMVTADGDEEFEISADDDTFVYVGNRLVLDMGGIHSESTGRFIINENAEVYAGVGEESLAYTGVTLKKGEASVIRVFHANRDSKNSVFGVKIYGMALGVVERNGETVVNYDSMNPGYVAPLGESMTVAIDQSRIIAMADNVKMLSFGIIAVCLTALIYAGLRYWQHGHNRGR